MWQNKSHNTTNMSFVPLSLHKQHIWSNPLAAIYIPAGSARPERGNKKTKVGLGMILGKMHSEEKIELKNSIRTLRNKDVLKKMQIIKTELKK